MGTLTVGSVVTVPFPFTDLSNAKRRPAVVLAKHGNSDFILCAVTSQGHKGLPWIALDATDFADGELRKNTSFAVFSKIMTVHESLINPVARLTDNKKDEILTAVRNLF